MAIGSYFDPPPAVHQHLPAPGGIEVEDDASPQDERAASVVRAMLSFGHGLQDTEHYVLRFAIAFFVAAIVTLAAIAVVGIMSL